LNHNDPSYFYVKLFTDSVIERIKTEKNIMKNPLEIFKEEAPKQVKYDQQWGDWYMYLVN